MELTETRAKTPASARAASASAELTVVAPTFNECANVEKLVAKLDAALAGIAWEAVFVDDNSPDGTAEAVKAVAARDPRIRCIRRVRRRGLAGAVVEGALSSAAPYVAVIDADLQHDETLLPRMLEQLKSGAAELVVASRYVGGPKTIEGLDGPMRRMGSDLANKLGRMVLRQDVSDPVSGFFMIRRELVDRVAPSLATEGFKILFDIIASQPEPLKIVELPYVFREREAGGSKLDKRIVIDYLGLLLSKLSGGVIPSRALMFGMVGASGLVVHLTVLQLLLSTDLNFSLIQFLAAMTAMTTNYIFNNITTYRDRRKRGLAFVVGYVKFCALCSISVFTSVAVATMVRSWGVYPQIAGASGAVLGALWNYVTTALAVW
ncbi:glycosyltransferase [Phenylobacterium montanum]|uniref:Glycosyltransferase family 2 protein n=1 Tax=Phenylobacterium montanum TaxID=2823693 RepID=A0A975FWB0_9CAUL|nr:glycosyltransferase family 2 protein [Caulobacter sp. S6]QUD86154.1 glycosyltransferase family 2 protein [Caulobacter sp. S6]